MSDQCTHLNQIRDVTPHQWVGSIDLKQAPLDR
jgi:hypothetical protein